MGSSAHYRHNSKCHGVGRRRCHLYLSVVQARAIRRVFYSFKKSADNSLSNSSDHYFRIEFVVLVACMFHVLVLLRRFFIGVPCRTLSPVTTEPALVIAAAASMANPIIYTIASKRFLKATGRACRLFCRHHNEEQLPISASQHTTQREVTCWSSVCYRFCHCQRPRPQDVGVIVCHPESATENTEETNLFSESE